ncbi:MAG: FAD-binding oxidoreductase [Deltaproteobacteria bacterium]|nr:FAD-binding oxidoreductase [Deltaproteobacteria bacterium]
MDEFDVIIIGAGSVGVPTAMALSEKGFKCLVLDWRPSQGQGQNKHAIGGIRATHSDPAKIKVSKRSLEIFSGWKDTYGEDIEWLKGGYTFPVYTEADADVLKSILPIQQSFGLNIDFVGPEEISAVIPGINPEGLLGGTHSMDDGSASPLLSINAFYRRARSLGSVFKFREKVMSIMVSSDRAIGVVTENSHYTAPVVIDAAGPRSRELCSSVEVGVPVFADSHEGAITEPTQSFFTTMVVDIRPGPGSKNYYFYQNPRGQVVFCITPDPPIVGMDMRETSLFLPQVCSRMVKLLPRLKNLRVRRIWRGLYPNTPDGSPIVGWNPDIEGLLHVTGMCGQGFMLGPGIAEVVARLVAGQSSDDDRKILNSFRLDRTFAGEESLK